MKIQFQKKWTKIACVTFAIFSMAVTANAQSTSDVAKKPTGTVRLVDNKGTIKYLQTSNGLTTIVNTSSDVTTTTWQLGGTLTADTYIDATGKVFALDGLQLATAVTASTNATDGSTHTTATGSGWTLLVRDEATGAIKKLLATDLIQSGQQVFTVTSGQVTTPAFTVSSGGPLPIVNKVSVYRNGAKLVAGTDYSVSGSVVTLIPATAAGPTNWALYVDDEIEVQWIK